MNGVGNVITIPVGSNGVTVEPELSMQKNDSLSMGLGLAEYVKGASPKPKVWVVAGTIVVPTVMVVFTSCTILEPPK
jgi:hypothetical protein